MEKKNDNFAFFQKLIIMHYINVRTIDNFFVR